MPHDAFGNEKDRVGTNPNPFRYCGEYFDVESGAYYLRARYYDPSIGRFTQEDAACFGLNWYAYCGNNPIRFHDSTGFHPEMISIDSDLDDEQIRLIFSNWEKFKTNKEIIDLIYKLSKVLNATAWGGLTSAVKIGNRAARKNYTFCDANGNYQYINGQMRSATRDIPYGLATIGLAGCEVIAVYNSMITLGNPQPFNEVADYFEDNGMFASGFFGTHVNALPEYFTDRGYSVTEVRLISGESCIKFDKAFAKGTTAIFSYYTDDGLNIHTVSISHAGDGGILVYNLFNDSTSEIPFSSIEDFILQYGYIPIVLYVIN